MDLFLELKEIISDIVWEVGFENYVVISTLIFTRGEIEKSALRASPIRYKKTSDNSSKSKS